MFPGNPTDRVESHYNEKLDSAVSHCKCRLLQLQEDSREEQTNNIKRENCAELKLYRQEWSKVEVALQCFHYCDLRWLIFPQDGILSINVRLEPNHQPTYSKTKDKISKLRKEDVT